LQHVAKVAKSFSNSHSVASTDRLGDFIGGFIGGIGGFIGAIGGFIGTSMRMTSSFLALVVFSAAPCTGIEQVQVTSDGTTATSRDDSPPEAPAILAMDGATLGVAMAKWAAADDYDEKALLFMRVTMLGTTGEAVTQLDNFVAADDGDGLMALISAASSHTCGEPPSGLAVQGAVAALGTLATGGTHAPQWKESSAGLTRCTKLATLGAVNATVTAMSAAGFDVTTCEQAWDIQHAGLHTIASICLGHDGKDGLGLPRTATKAEAEAGLPSEANFRREAAADAGAIEAIVSVFAALRDCVKCGLNKSKARELLKIAHHAFQRVLLGHDDAGGRRRARAAAADAIPAMVGALDKAFSKELMRKTIETNSILMGQDDPDGDGKADPALDRAWQEEIARRPTLGEKMQEVMHQMYREDPGRVRDAHHQAGMEMPEREGV
jgi:hypothetical protein